MAVPVDFTFHPGWWNKNAGISFNEEFFYDPEYRIQSDIKMRKVLFEKFGDLGFGEKDPEPRAILGSDLIACGFLHSGILGCRIEFSDQDPPQVICQNLDEDKIQSIKPPDLDRSDIWAKVESQIDYLLKKYGYVESCINLMGIQNIALDVRGQDIFIDYYDNPDVAHHLLDVSTKTSIDIAGRLKRVSKNLSAGVTSIVKRTLPDVYLTSNCSVEMVSLDIYNDFLLKYDNMLAEQFKPFGIHHCGKTMEHVVEGYSRVKNLVFAEVGAFSDIKYVRNCLPNVYLNARYSPVRLKEASLSQLEQDIMDIATKAKPLNLLSISCVGIDADTENGQIRNFIKACKEIEG